MLFTVSLMSSHSVFRNWVGLTMTKSPSDANRSTLRWSLVNSSSKPPVSGLASGLGASVFTPAPKLAETVGCAGAVRVEIKLFCGATWTDG